MTTRNKKITISPFSHSAKHQPKIPKSSSSQNLTNQIKSIKL